MSCLFRTSGQLSQALMLTVLAAGYLGACGGGQRPPKTSNGQEEGSDLSAGATTTEVCRSAVQANGSGVDLEITSRHRASTNFQGVALDFRRRHSPIEGVTIVVLAKDGTRYHAGSNEDGEFSFSLPSGPYEASFYWDDSKIKVAFILRESTAIRARIYFAGSADVLFP